VDSSKAAVADALTWKQTQLYNGGNMCAVRLTFTLWNFKEQIDLIVIV